MHTAIICLIFGMYCPDYHFQVMRLPLNQGIQFQSSLHRINLSADCLPVWDSAPEAIRQGLGPLLRPMTFLCRTIVRELDGKSIPDAVTTACRPAFSSMLGVVHLDMCDTLQRWGLGSVFLRLGISVAVCLVVAASIIILSWAFFRQTRAVRKTAMLLGFCAPGTLLLALALERLTVGSVSANSLAQFLVGFSDTAEVSSLYVGYISYLTATLVTCAFCGILTWATGNEVTQRVRRLAALHGRPELQKDRERSSTLGRAESASTLVEAGTDGPPRRRQ